MIDTWMVRAAHCLHLTKQSILSLVAWWRWTLSINSGYDVNGRLQKFIALSLIAYCQLCSHDLNYAVSCRQLWPLQARSRWIWERSLTAGVRFCSAVPVLPKVRFGSSSLRAWKIWVRFGSWNVGFKFCSVLYGFGRLAVLALRHCMLKHWPESCEMVFCNISFKIQESKDFVTRLSSSHEKIQTFHLGSTSSSRGGVHAVASTRL